MEQRRMSWPGSQQEPNHFVHIYMCNDQESNRHLTVSKAIHPEICIYPLENSMSMRLKTHSCKTGVLWAKIPGFLTRVSPPNVNIVGTMFISVFMMTRNLQQMNRDNSWYGEALWKPMLAYCPTPSSTCSPHALIYKQVSREAAATGLMPGTLGQGLGMLCWAATVGPKEHAEQLKALSQPASDTACPKNPISLSHSLHYLWKLSTILISLRTLKMKTISRICWLLYFVAEKGKKIIFFSPEK